MTTAAPVLVPPRKVDTDQQTLDWVNDRRAELGADDLAEMPDGVAYDMNDCPIARALTANGYTGWCGPHTGGAFKSLEPGGYFTFPLPEYVEQWVREFDAA